METSSVRIITKKKFMDFVDNLIKNEKQRVIGVKAKDDHFVYAPLEKAEELRLDFDVTLLPPKKYFLPQYDEVLSFKLTDPIHVEEPKDKKAPIIIGVHPYDIIALEQTDAVYLDPQRDTIYKKRREEAIIIGVDIINVSERSFAASMNTHIADRGFDLLLTDLGKNIAVTIGSKKGEKLLEKYVNTTNATKQDIERIEKIRRNLPKKYKNKVKIEKEKWASLLSANYENAIWEEKSDLCLECTSCTIVCPTCFCYDVHDELDLNMKNGRRIRTWDGCLLRDFTKVGSGEIFRKEIRERYRHRFYRKGNYLYSRYGFVACVGCGRCGTACLPDIADPCKLINQLSGFGGGDKHDRFFIKKETLSYPDSPIHTPKSATIKKITRLTENETLFEIDLDDRKPLGHKPGQFVEISLLGVGEAPFCISSPPTKTATFEIAVRRVGNVTSKLFTMKPGDK
ncbi:MAG: 4Fe-4S dicluster domain-containing protein, partial [Candidatus Thermoplasmatota archaeon]